MLWAQLAFFVVCFPFTVLYSFPFYCLVEFPLSNRTELWGYPSVWIVYGYNGWFRESYSVSKMYFILNYSFIEATLNPRCDGKMSSFFKNKKKTISLLNNKYPKNVIGLWYVWGLSDVLFLWLLQRVASLHMFLMENQLICLDVTLTNINNRIATVRSQL